MSFLENFIKNKDVALYGYKEKHLPDILSQKNKGWVRVFIKKDKNKTIPKNTFFSVSFYENVRHIKWYPGEICFLDNEALKSLIVGFPLSRYVMVSLGLSSFKYWPIAFIGLIRRVVFHKQIRVLKIIRFPIVKKNRWWLALERPKKNSVWLHSHEAKIQRLLDYLREEKVNYVVLRFFDKLPRVFREEGDLDILVADEDEEKVKKFIDKQLGSVPVEIRSVSSSNYYGIPYFPQPFAKRILESAIDGPAGSRIPSPKELFLGLIYHVLYHRSEGTYAGIPSRLPEIKVNPCPKHDYTSILSRMAKELNINISINMESLDDYLAREGLRPNFDTLAKIAEWNEWVYQRFFSKPNNQEVKIGVFVFKEKVLQLGFIDSIISAIEKDGFAIIRNKRLKNSEQDYAAERLRGGTWIKEKPAIILVVLDVYSIYFKNQSKFFLGYSRLKILKERLRSNFDKNRIGLIHSTDNTEEAWQYIETCFPSETLAIKEELSAFCKNYQLSFKERIKANLKIFSYYKRGMISKVKNSMINFLVK